MKTFFEENKHKRLLSIYYTAGYPHLQDTLEIAEELQDADVDFLEIGIPFSDPIADGPTIQASSEQALKNGMRLRLLFQQLEDLRPNIRIPVFLMGYFNTVLQFGVEAFCQACDEVGVDGVILPDLPLEVYEQAYKPYFQQYGIPAIFLITPQTEEARIRQIDQHSDAFIYMLSSSSITGNQLAANAEVMTYFSKIKDMQLESPTVIGFGISDHKTFQTATDYADGAIIGSAFVRLLARTAESSDRAEQIKKFIASIRNQQE